MTYRTDGSHVRCGLLNPRPGVYAEIRWLRRDALNSMPVAELSRYRFPEKSVFLFDRKVTIEIDGGFHFDEDQVSELCRVLDELTASPSLFNRRKFMRDFPQHEIFFRKRETPHDET